MAKHNEKHLATEQLSAFVDHQLSSEEQSTVEAHLQSCQQCQHALASLRQTVALLHALPQPEMPRSFVLSPGISYLQERPERQSESHQSQQQPVTNQRKLRRTRLQRTIRVVSTLVAVVGLFFLLSTVLSAFPHDLASTTTGSAPSVTSPFAGANQTPHLSATARKLTPNEQGATPIVPSTPTISSRSKQQQDTAQFSALLPDITTALGRQEIGLFLLVLGVVGVLLTIRRRPRRTS